MERYKKGGIVTTKSREGRQRTALVVFGLFWIMTLVLLIGGPGNIASLVSSNTASADPTGTDTFNILSASVTDCNNNGYDACQEYSNSFGDAQAVAKLRYNYLDTTKEDGSTYVSKTDTFNYKCSGDTVYIREVIDTPDIDSSSTGVTSGYRSFPTNNEVSLQEIAGETINDFQVICVDHDTQGDGWASAWTWVNYEGLTFEKDSDNDGVYDRNDQFPNNRKCSKDSDGDGVCDFNDACDNKKGSHENGCPDTDGDGVINDFDACKGTPDGADVTEKGCAVDSDNDGVPDINDECSNTANGVSVDDNGCMLDTDGDGIPDNQDACPNKGASDLGLTSDGCPVQDDDQDGITNSMDACPTTYGTQTNGCPDTLDYILNFFDGLGLPIR